MTTTATSTTSRTALFVTGADELLDYYAEMEATVHRDFWSSSRNFSKMELADVTLEMTKLQANGKEVHVAVEGTDAGVTVPAAVVASFEGPLAVVISVYKGNGLSSRLQDVDSAGNGANPQAMMKLELHSPSGKQRVSGLTEPILLQMPPVNKSSGVECAYWDVENEHWAYDGVETRWVGADSLVCAATHLTLFAAILRGILTALACSQLTLFNAKAIQTLIRGEWLTSPVGIAFTILLLCYIFFMLSACYIDRRRKKTWSDECFLIPRGPPPVPDEIDLCWRKTVSSASASRDATCFESFREQVTMAAKEAGTEIISSFFEFFGQAREMMSQCQEFCCNNRDLKSAVQEATALLTLKSLRLQVAAATGMSDEAVEFAMEDEKLLKYFAEAAGKAEDEGADPCRSLLAWYELHQGVADSLDNTWNKVGTFRRLPIAMWRLFLLNNPFLSVYTFNPFWGSALRVLILMCEVSGSLLLGVFLFQNTAGAMDSDSPDECEAGGFWEKVGQMIVIGTASAVIAALPAALLSLLHSRKLVKCDYEQCEKWKRQLRKWRTKDLVLWFLGLLYVAFCLFVVALFLANIHPNDEPEWGVSSLTSLAEDAILLPLAVALMVSLLAAGSVMLLSCLTGTRRAEVLDKQREALEESGTWVLQPRITRTALVSV